jgi:hypothetical protein
MAEEKIGIRIDRDIDFAIRLGLFEFRRSAKTVTTITVQREVNDNDPPAGTSGQKRNRIGPARRHGGSAEINAGWIKPAPMGEADS